LSDLENVTAPVVTLILFTSDILIRIFFLVLVIVLVLALVTNVTLFSLLFNYSFFSNL